MKVRFHKRISRAVRGYFRRTTLARYGIGVVADTSNGLFIVDPGDFGVARRLLREGSYDYEAVLWLADALRGQAGLIVVVGAHIGSILVPLSAWTNQIIGFEADPVNYRLAQLNLLLNGVEHATLINKAVGESHGFATLVRNPINTGNTSIRLVEGIKDTEVEVTTLDAALKTRSDHCIDLIVIDIEGHELHALRGAKNTLERTEKLYLEYAPEQLAEHGTTGTQLIDFAFDHFAHMYCLDDQVLSFDRATARHFLHSIDKKRGLLKNLLFSKTALPAEALRRTR